MSKKLIYLMSFVLVLALTGTASADHIITVPDAGFDDHVLNNVGDYVYVGNSSYAGPWQSAGGDAWIDYGYWVGDVDLPALSGNNKLYPWEEVEDYTYQILDETFIEGATYTLSVWLGLAWSGYDDYWSIYFTGENYKNNLTEASGSAPVGSWGQVSLVYTATAADAGKKIGIKMTGAIYVTFEDVTLSYDDPVLAANPNPANEQTDVLRDVVLSWTPGVYAAPINGHKVYLSENFNDVNDGIGAITQSDSSYARPQRLDFNTIYYWRVDEVNNVKPDSPWIGDVWSFTTELLAYPIDGNNITATASSIHQADAGPENTINGLGLDANDLHSIEPTDMWLSGDEPNGAWIEYELDKLYKLHEMWVWNSNGMMESVLGFGFKDVTIEHSTNGTDYTTLGTTHEFARAPGTSGYAHNTTIDFSGAAAKYVRLTANSNWGGIMDQYRLSEVRFFSIPVLAREPSPDSGTADVDVDVTLGFRAGREAVTHDVYFSSDEQAVMDGNVPVSTVTETSYGPLSLDLDTTYYWKINEVNEAETTTTWQGDIWNFTTREFFIVDDFENYNDYPPDEIWSTWVDGYGVPANGATVGYPNPDWNAGEHYAETTIVHGGDQSMPFFYSNTGGATYSEGKRTFAVSQDWTKAGVQTLALHFRGAGGNTGQLYVEVNGSKVVYDGDAGDIQRAGWQAWNIELASFGTNLQSVTTLAIGVDGNGASGTLYFDDFRLYSYSPQFITPVEPTSAGLIGHWKFDGDTLDYSGLGNHGTANGGPAYAVGKVGQAMSFDGTDDYVTIDGVADDITSNDITLAAWVNTAADDDWYPVISCNTAGGDNVGWLAVDYGYVDFDPFTGTTFVTDNDWHHLAYTRFGDCGSLYVDGVLDGTHTPNFNFSADNLWSIGQEWDTGGTSDFLIGTVDDARIYNYALSLEEVAWLAGRTEPFDKPF